MKVQADRASATAPDETVLVSEEGGVMTILFNRPGSRNAFTLDMYERLAAIFGALQAAGPVRAVVLAGVGGEAFGSGTDISEFVDFSTAEHALGYENMLARILAIVEACPIPTIAAIAGACTGGALMIAACCDIRLATPASRFGIPVARTLGNTLSLANHARLAALIGTGRVVDMMLTARLLDGEQAQAAGLVSELAADHGALMTRAAELARTLTTHAPLTMRATKEAVRVLRYATDPGLERELILKAYVSEDFKEGVKAFLGKRKPVWKGR